jgi:lipopolysaccharide export system protein LptA
VKKLLHFFKFLVCLTLIFSTHDGVFAQTTITPQGDTLQRVDILNYTKTLTLKTINDTTRLTIIAGNVKLKQGTTLFYCDSCVINNNSNVFEAWGHVHINDSDTANVYSSHLRYLMKDKLAYLDGGVRMTDGNATLTTPDLEYNMETNIGTYTHGGKVVNKQTVLTSQEGMYFAGQKDIYFTKNVVLTDPAYKITTDSLLHNTRDQATRFISFTTIVDSSGRIIKTKEGYVDQKTRKTYFGRRPEITDKDTKIIADTVEDDDSTHISVATGNAIIVDNKNGTTIIAGIIFRNKKTEAILATRKPLMIIKQENDSIYVTADTLFSARLTDLYGRDSLVVDTIKSIKVTTINEKDSNNRYFEAYRHVRIFNDSLQAVCDSMFYSFKDSIFRLYDDPVVWAKESQITGDTILLYTKNKKADKIEAYENSFMVNKLDTQAFNQIKATRMDGYFVDGNIDSVRAKGFAECIYYVQDEDSAYTGINESKCDIIDIYFRNKELFKVAMRSAVTGTLWPIRQKSPSEMRLTNFRWLEGRRPKTKFEMYE